MAGIEAWWRSAVVYQVFPASFCDANSDGFGDSRASSRGWTTWRYLLRGTPFLYQGEQLGMTNAPLSSLADVTEVEALSHQTAAVAAGADPTTVLAGIPPWAATTRGRRCSGTPGRPRLLP